MLCYKDMTFCPFWMYCKYGEDCERALTLEVLEDAESFGLPIARFAEKPKCFVEIWSIGRKDEVLNYLKEVDDGKHEKESGKEERSECTCGPDSPCKDGGTCRCKSREGGKREE